MPKGNEGEGRDVRVLGLRLHNFKGVEKFTVEPEGRDATIQGDNASGKTTLSDAYWWLLVGKESTGRAQFSLKTLNPDGSVQSGLDHEVEGRFRIDEQEVTLKKTYREKWTKRRGRAEREFDGHVTDHQVDGVPVSATEFQGKVTDMLGGIDDQAVRLVTDPYFFSSGLHWQERRNILLQICGDVSDEQVIEASRELAPLADILGKRTAGDHRKVIMSRRREINEELDRIPTRIDEVTRGVADQASQENEDSVLTLIEGLRGRRSTLEKQKADILSGGELVSKRLEIRELDLEVERLRQKGEQEAAAPTMEKQQQLKEALAEQSRLEERMASLSRQIKATEAQVADTKERTERHRQAWTEHVNLKFVHDEPDTCAACGQSLPVDRVREARQRAEDAWRSEISSRLERIQDEGKKMAAQVEQDEQEIAKLNKYREEDEKSLRSITTEVKDIQASITDKGAAQMPEQVVQELAVLREKKAAVEKEVEDLWADRKSKAEEVQAHIQSVDASIQEKEAEASRFDQRRRADRRVEELKQEQKALSAEYEDLEHQLYLLDKYTEVKVSLLTERINSRFREARFKLFNIQVNGAVEECCEVSHNGVPWPDLNHGAKISIGLDVIETLTIHYGIRLPVWVDQSESISVLPKVASQMIRLRVVKGQKNLKVEEAQ